jgi:ABC-type nickel/cobalt efflux system permease component RcnA
MTALLWSAVALGFVLGLRHALDPDHVVAVSTIVSTEPSWRRSSLIGSFWGLGHATSLLVLGGLIVAFRINITELAASRLEIIVSVMLVGLGVYAIRSARAGFRLHAHKHTHEDAVAHGKKEHVHLHVHRPHAEAVHQHAHPLRFGLRPYAIGLVHGVAGSGGLALLVMATAKSTAEGLLYMAALALGAFVGMGILSGLMTLPLSALRARYETLHLRFQYLSGICSVAFGVWLFAEHLNEFM